MRFLEGAAETLKSSNLRWIIFELNEVDQHFTDIISILSTSGFDEVKRYNVPNEIDLYNRVFESTNNN